MRGRVTKRDILNFIESGRRLCVPQDFLGKSALVAPQVTSAASRTGSTHVAPNVRKRWAPESPPMSVMRKKSPNI
jgi:hypothetical protein